MNAGERFYRLLLKLYPQAHRQAYGEQMAVHFRDQLREARGDGVCGVARMWLRLILDAAVTIPVEHWAQTKEGWMNSRKAGLKPLPWWQLALIVAPGIFFISSYVVDDRIGAAVVIILLAAIGISWRQDRRFPGWGLLLPGFLVGWVATWFAFRLMTNSNWSWRSLQVGSTLGIALMMGISALLIVSHAHWRGLPAAIWQILGCMLLATLGIAFIEVNRSTPLTGLPKLGLVVMYTISYLGWLLSLMSPIALGLPLSRRYGLTAVLFVSGCLYVVYDGYLDPAEGLGFFMGSAALIWIARLIVLAAMLVVAPLWSLRARSLRWRKLGLLIPIGVSLFSAAFLSNVLRGVEGWNIWLRSGLITLNIFLLYALAVSLYGAAGVEAPALEEARAIRAES